MNGLPDPGSVTQCWFEWVLAASWQLALLIGVIAVVALALRRVSARLRYLLWMLVLIKALTPPSLGTAWSLGKWLTPELWHGVQTEWRAAENAGPDDAVSIPQVPPALQSGAPPLSANHASSPNSALSPNLVSPSASHPFPVIPAIATISSNPAWTVAQLLFPIWLAGGALFALLIGAQYARLTRSLRHARLVEEGLLRITLERLALRMGRENPPELLLAESVSSPFLFGLFRPRIVLPLALERSLGPEQLEDVLLHELTHWRRRDLWISWLQIIVQGLFWFHPLVWLAGAQLRHECECACDEALLESGCSRARRYGETLLHVLLAARGRSAVGMGMLGIFERNTRLRRRVEAIMEQEDKPRRFGWGNWLLLVALGAALLPMTPVPTQAQSSVLPTAAEATAVPVTVIAPDNSASATPTPQPTPLLDTYSDQEIAATSAKVFFDRIGHFDAHQPLAVVWALEKKAKSASETERAEMLDMATEIIHDAQQGAFPRWVSCYVIGSLEDPRGIPTLATELMTDPEDTVRGYAAIALGRFQQSEAIAALEQAAATEKNADVLRYIAKAKAGDYFVDPKRIEKAGLWVIAGSNSVACTMIVAPDDPQGEHSIGMRTVRGNPTGISTVMHSALDQTWIGKRLRMSADMCTTNVQGTAALWMRVDGKDGNPLGFDKMDGRQIKGTTPYAHYEVVLDIPQETGMTVYGILLKGAGEASLRNLKFETVDSSIATTDQPDSTPPQRAEELSVLRPDLSSNDVTTWTTQLNPNQRQFLDWTNRRFDRFFDRRDFSKWPAAERDALLDQTLRKLGGPQNREYYEAINTLGAIGDPKAVQPLLAIATDRVGEDCRDNWMATRALGMIGDKSVVPSLCHLVYHTNTNVHFWAQIALVRLTGQNFGYDWMRWGKWWNEQGGQPPFTAEKIRWWDDPKFDEASTAEALMKADQDFLSKNRPTPSRSPDADTADTTGGAALAPGGPPEIVSVTPAVGASDVDPATGEIKVTFDRDMSMRGFSWTGGGPEFPAMPEGSKPIWRDARTCVLPVKLEPGKFYRVGINSTSHRNFRSAAGVPVVPATIMFVTRGAAQDELDKLLQPKIVALEPASEATGVDPHITELRVTFNVAMGGGMSWTGGGEHFPEIPQGQRGHWSEDHKTCILPVTLKPNWDYQLGLNSPSFQNFTSAGGVPLEPVLYTFSTGP